MTNEEYFLWLKAINMAALSHHGQFRKDGETPYIFHPLGVMELVDSLKEKTVAVLHDIVEDTPVTYLLLVIEGFPDDIVDAVVCLTRRREETYKDFILRVKKNPLARKVKIADIRHNLRTIDKIPDLNEAYSLNRRWQDALTELQN